jgi:hypothetical protein
MDTKPALQEEGALADTLKGTPHDAAVTLLRYGADWIVEPKGLYQVAPERESRRPETFATVSPRSLQNLLPVPRRHFETLKRMLGGGGGGWRNSKNIKK